MDCTDTEEIAFQFKAIFELDNMRLSLLRFNYVREKVHQFSCNWLWREFGYSLDFGLLTLV